MASSSDSHTDFSVIVGLGATGLSCARYLHARGMPFSVVDTREQPPQLSAFRQQYPDVEVMLGQLDAPVFQKASQIILSPGLSLREPAVAQQLKRGVPVIGDIEIFARAVKQPVIAITGTNAKSTVTTLVGEMAKAAGYRVQVGGNLGVPVLDLLQESDDANLFVLELSSFQLETTHTLNAAVATVLNVTPDHMDRYETLTDYQQAKLRVYQNCRTAVCNRDDSLTDMTHSNKFYFTMNEPSANEFGLRQSAGNTFLAFDDQLLMDVKELPIVGRHYQANALSALAIGHGAGFSLEAMVKVLRTFTGLPHRCQFVRKRNDINWYNDSKGTNVGATQAAIEGLGAEIDGKLVIIAGGLGKSADFSPLLPALEKYTRHIVLIGEAAQELAEMIGNRIPVSLANSMEEAVQQCDNLSKPGDRVLLSPACASFDMFDGFAHRGDVFTQLVRNLP